MNFLNRASCILAMCLLAQCQAKVIYSETSYVDEYGNYIDRSSAYESEYEVNSDDSGFDGSEYENYYDGSAGYESEYGVNIDGSADYGSGFIIIWDDEDGADDYEGSGSGHGEIKMISPEVYEEDLYKTGKHFKHNMSIIFPDEDQSLTQNHNDAKDNMREVDHILEKEVEDESKNNLLENNDKISLEKENEDITSEEFKEIISDLGNILTEMEDEYILENNIIEKKEGEFYFNKEVISNSETDDFFADPEAIHSIHENINHHDSSLGTMKIIMFTSAGILTLLVLLLIIILLVYLTSKEREGKHTASGYVKRIRLISTNSTMKL